MLVNSNKWEVFWGRFPPLKKWELGLWYGQAYRLLPSRYIWTGHSLRGAERYTVACPILYGGLGQCLNLATILFYQINLLKLLYPSSQTVTAWECGHILPYQCFSCASSGFPVPIPFKYSYLWREEALDLATSVTRLALLTCASGPNELLLNWNGFLGLLSSASTSNTVWGKGHFFLHQYFSAASSGFPVLTSLPFHTNCTPKHIPRKNMPLNRVGYLYFEMNILKMNEDKDFAIPDNPQTAFLSINQYARTGAFHEMEHNTIT